MRLYALYSTSVITGFCLMALEILGPRYLSSRFGTSVDVWAAIISTFVISWSIGSWIGGRVADKARTNTPLGWVILISGIMFLLLPAWATSFVEALPASVHAHRAGSLLACLVLFMPPFILLGGISPLIIKLIFTDDKGVGSTAGTLYAISSVGNILGILVTNYFLLAAFELNSNTLALGSVLALTGLAHIVINIESHTHSGDQSSPARSDEAAGAA